MTLFVGDTKADPGTPPPIEGASGLQQHCNNQLLKKSTIGIDIHGHA